MPTKDAPRQRERAYLLAVVSVITEVSLAFVKGGEETSRLDHVVGSSSLPWDFSRVLPTRTGQIGRSGRGINN